MQFIHALQNLENPNSLASRLRRRRARTIQALIVKARPAGEPRRIVDLGGEAVYWTRVLDRSFLEAFRVTITLVNRQAAASDQDPLFETVTADACDLPLFKDGSFDLVHSNSVIEHLGDWLRVEAFAREARRLAPLLYVQTPNYGFPIEPHYSAPFFHWRSPSDQAHALIRRGRGFIPRARDLGEAMRQVEAARLLDARQMAFLFPDAAIRRERLLGLTKSLVAVRA